MNIKFLIKSAITFLLIFYFLTAFIVGELDASCWESSTRFFLIFLTCIATLLTAAIKDDQL